nr:thiolase family protein [Nitrososphaerota archaeon]
VLCLAAESPMTSVGGFSNPSADGHRRDYENPFGVMGPNSLFGLVMRRYMHEYGLNEQHMGKIALTQRLHANLNPNAYFHNQPLTMEEYLNSRMIADPFRLLDCVMPVNGGLGLLVTTSERAKKMTEKPVYLLGFGECDNYYHDGNRVRPDITYMGIRAASKSAHEMAGTTPNEMDFFQPYDDYTIAVLLQLEEAGFCEKRKGADYIDKTDISYKGDLPVNTGGGQISSGQPGLAGGLVQIVEAVRQLRNEGDKRQVKDCRIGMATGIGGFDYGRTIKNNIVLILGNKV